MNTVLIVTTSKDMSILDRTRPGVTTVLLGDSFELPEGDFEAVYVRDPFVASLDTSLIEAQISKVIAQYPDATFIDGISSYDDLLIEDKWRQYQLLEDFIPKTSLGNAESAEEEGKIAKKRISARSRDILFHWNKGDIDESWIVQDKLEVLEEIRVYSVGSTVLPIASIKQPKTEASKTKVVDVRSLTHEEFIFAEQVLAAAPNYSLLGLDIAVTPQGLRLIELNRSPQFLRYNELVGGDLLERMMHKVVQDGKAPQVTLGCAEKIDVPSLNLEGILAKVDTGAFSGALHATNIQLSKDGKTLTYWPLGDESKQVVTTDFHIRRVRSAHGHVITRYVIPVTLRIQGVEYESHVGIAGRESMKFDALIGRRFLRKHNMLVDVSINSEYDEEWEKLS